MGTDWIAILREQGELTKELAAEVPKALANPDLTLDQASRLYRLVEKSAQDFDRIIEGMDEEDLDEALYEAADSLEDIWSALSVATANKVRTMQGLDPIEFEDDGDDDMD